MLLSVIIPAFNEAQTIEQVIQEIKTLPIDKEIIVVNDGSTDATYEILERIHDNPRLKVIQCKENRGKGSAIRRGLERITGNIVVIQDADLELLPKDLPMVIEPIQREAVQVVYGSRFLNGRKHASILHYIANRMLTGFANLLYGSHITDEATGYKAFSADLISDLNLTCDGFEFCPEVTAKVLRAGYHIHEVAVSYFPRARRQGKKLRYWQHGLSAAWTLLRCRFMHRKEVLKTANSAIFRDNPL